MLDVFDSYPAIFFFRSHPRWFFCLVLVPLLCDSVQSRSSRKKNHPIAIWLNVEGASRYAARNCAFWMSSLVFFPLFPFSVPDEIFHDQTKEEEDVLGRQNSYFFSPFRFLRLWKIPTTQSKKKIKKKSTGLELFWGSLSLQDTKKNWNLFFLRT